MFLPASCQGCGDVGRGPCERCWSALFAAPVRRQVDGLDTLIACAPYEGVVASLVGALKFRGAHRLAAALAIAMAHHAAVDVDAVCWIPSTSTHRRRRGYDQGALLARAVSRRLDRPLRHLLKRRRGPPQLGLNREDRLRGPHLVSSRRVPSRVLVVDDVVTSGGSFGAAARVLRHAGAEQVHGAAIAATRR